MSNFCKECGHPVKDHGPAGCEWEVRDYGQLDCGCQEWQTATTPIPVMVRVAGKPYHCSCGANVFSKLSSDTYRCNGCGATYEGKDAA